MSQFQIWFNYNSYWHCLGCFAAHVANFQVDAFFLVRGVKGWHTVIKNYGISMSQCYGWNQYNAAILNSGEVSGDE